MAETMKWEYRVIGIGSFWSTPKDEEMEGVLNELGAEGWEVFSVYTQYGTSKVWVAAKRPLSSSARRRSGWPE